MKYLLIGLLIVVLLVGGGAFFIKKQFSSSSSMPTPTPTEEVVEQLSTEKQPKVSLTYKADGHYVTVNITNLNADIVEYNLIYDAKIKRNGITSQVNTGINASEKVTGKSSYSKEQLLGSESSGHLTFHENIQNATLQLTLRNAAGRSVFTSTYPFAVSPGKSQDLIPQ